MINCYNKPTKAQPAWAALEITKRSSIVRQFLAQLASNSLVLKQERDLPEVIEAARHLLLDIEKQLAAPITLPGPSPVNPTSYIWKPVVWWLQCAMTVLALNTGC